MIESHPVEESKRRTLLKSPKMNTEPISPRDRSLYIENSTSKYSIIISFAELEKYIPGVERLQWHAVQPVIALSLLFCTQVEPVFMEWVWF